MFKEVFGVNHIKAYIFDDDILMSGYEIRITTLAHACMYTCTRMHVHLRTHACTLAHACMYTCTRMHVHAHIRI